MQTTMAAIGILMLIILSAAAYIACQKSQEQDSLIKDLTEKLTLTESSINSLMNSTIIVRKKPSSEEVDRIIDSSTSMISSSKEKCIINIDRQVDCESLHENSKSSSLDSL